MPLPLARCNAGRYTLPRLALIGDAAHSIHPLAGQGVNLGLTDAKVLADAIAAAGVSGGCVCAGVQWWLWLLLPLCCGRCPAGCVLLRSTTCVGGQASCLILPCPQRLPYCLPWSCCEYAVECGQDIGSAAWLEEQYEQL